MNPEAQPEQKSIEEIQNSLEYQTKLKNATEDAEKFAARVRATANGTPSESDIAQLRDEYNKISESALIAHDSLSDDTNSARSEHAESGLRIKGTDGSFMASIRIAFLEALGDGDYNADTPARKLFESQISGGTGHGLYETRERKYL